MLGKSHSYKGLPPTSDAFEQEFDQCRGIVYSVMRRYQLNGYDQDDWLQEGRLIYWKSRECFDESQGISLMGFFSINFRRHVISLFRSQMAQKRNYGIRTVSLEEVTERVGDASLKTMSFHEATGVDGVVLRDLLKSFTQMLSEFELIVWLNLLLGKSPEEISEEEKITVEKVDHAIDRVKRKIRITL